MQFRRAKNRIQVLAYRGYDKEKKRSIIKMLGSFDAETFEYPDSLTNDMTVDEKEELQSYIESMRHSNRNFLLKIETLYLYRSIDKVSASLTGEIDYMTDEVANGLYASIDGLYKALRKAGYKRPSKAKSELVSDNLSESDGIGNGLDFIASSYSGVDPDGHDGGS